MAHQKEYAQHKKETSDEKLHFMRSVCISEQRMPYIYIYDRRHQLWGYKHAK